MKVPKATQLPSGAWRVRVFVNGETVSITRPTEKEAIAEAMAIKAGLIEKAKRAPKDMTLREAIDEYIAMREPVLSVSTIRGYSYIRDFRFPAVMDRTINKTTDTMYQRAVNDAAKVLAPKTVKNSWMFVATVLKTIAGREVSCVLPQVIQDERPWLEPEDVSIFTKAIAGHPHEIPMLLALHGLRASEILDITWQDIDLRKKEIKVHGSAVRDKNNELIHKPTNKNSSSRRTVPILIDQLADSVESADHSTEYVSTIKATGLYNSINTVCRQNGLPEVGIHGLRHSFASICYHLNIPEQLTMALGGWSNPATMRKIYTHLASKDKLKHADTLRNFFNNTSK